MSLTSTLAISAKDNYSTNDKISINLVTPIPTGFDDDANLIPDAIGSYVLQYNATDENGNTTPTPFDFTINVKDVSRPTISYTGSSFKDGNPYMQVEAGVDTDLEDETLMELKATDSKGVDMTTPDIYLFNSRGYSQNILGSYVVTYKVDDSYGKTSLAFNYSIDVKDTTAPTITGATSLTAPLAMGTSISLTDDSVLGITIDDSFDTTPNLIIHDDGGFDKNKPGTYTISYDASDDSGNLYSEVHAGTYYTYSIQVTDQTAPLLSGAIADTVSAGVEIGQSYIDDYASRGIIVSDNYDSEPTIIAKYVDETGVTIIPDTSRAGNIIVNYDAVDDTGNKYSDPLPIGYGTQYQYIIHVVDDVAPVITGDIEKTIDFGLLSKSFDPLNPNTLGLTITDNVDKNPQLILDSSSDIYNGEKAGVYNMKYAAVDNDNNTSEPWNYTITITTQPPTITTSGDQTVTINPSINNDWINHPKNVGIKASGEDGNFDGVSDDLTDLITVSENGGFDSTKVGVYPVTYKVIDPITEKIATATINIETKEDIKPRFFGQSKVDIPQGTEFDYKTSESTGVYLSINTVINLEEGIDSGVITIANLGTDSDASTTADDFKGNGTDENGKYEIEYTATFNGYVTTQKYTINVVAPIKPIILGKNHANYFTDEAIPYNSPREMGLIGISSRFSDLTDEIKNVSITDDIGNVAVLDEAGNNAEGTYILTYQVKDPYTMALSELYTYTIQIASSESPIFTYTPPEIASDKKGMISYTYDESTNSASELWQGGYNGNFDVANKRLTAQSANTGENIPIVVMSTNGYSPTILGNYEITYKAYDESNDTTSNFVIDASVTDTLPPKFIGSTSYVSALGIPFSKTDTSLSIMDLVDGTFSDWSDSPSADHMTITKTYSSTDASIKFKGDGTDAAGTYIIEIYTQDSSNNSDETTISITVKDIAPPVWSQAGQTFTFFAYTPTYILMNDFSNNPASIGSRIGSFPYTNYNNSALPWLDGQKVDSTTNTQVGSYWAGGDKADEYPSGKIDLVFGTNTFNETYCGTDSFKNTVCNTSRIVVNRA